MLCTTQPNRNQETSNSRLQLVKEQKHGETTSLRYRLAVGKKTLELRLGQAQLKICSANHSSCALTTSAQRGI